MPDPTVACPACGKEFRLTDSLAAPLLEATRREHEQALARKDAEFAERLRKDRETRVAEEAKKARLELEAELASRDRMNADQAKTIQVLNAKLTTAQVAEVELRRKQRELDEKSREVDLTVEKRVAAEIAAVEARAVQRADESNRMKLAEKDKVVADALRQVEEMKRRMEQGSQQLQGEVQELDLEALLRGRFPHDAVEPVPKGEHGGDALQRVRGPVGQACGSILWESKRTKAWSDGWLTKLRDDQRLAKADLAILVTTALPKGVETFECVDGVWVTSPRVALAVATVLRQSLVEIASARLTAEGQQTKMHLVYEYLTGKRFRHVVETIVARFSEMQADLDKERKSLTRQWAKREAQIQGVIEATASMYGDLQGIAGRSLQEIAGLDGLALPDATGGTEPA